VEFGNLLQRLAADRLTSSAIELVAVVAVLDFVLGSLRAIANGTFVLSAFDVWVRKQVAGRVLPILLVLVAGTVVGDVSLGEFHFNVLTATALAAAATFVVSTAKSIADSLNANAPDAVPTE
jgi:hypothetical protein